MKKVIWDEAWSEGGGEGQRKKAKVYVYRRRKVSKGENDVGNCSPLTNKQRIKRTACH